jgi:hypothetical protein
MNVRATKRILFLLVVAVLLLCAGAVLANAPPVIDRHVMGSGGGHVESPPYVLDATIGQATTGTDSADPYQICAGFWCRAVYDVFLPLVLRDYP